MQNFERFQKAASRDKQRYEQKRDVGILNIFGVGSIGDVGDVSGKLRVYLYLGILQVG